MQRKQRWRRAVSVKADQNHLNDYLEGHREIFVARGIGLVCRVSENPKLRYMPSNICLD